MAKKAPEAAQNRYYAARIEAAKGNHSFETRVAAADAISGLTEDTLKKYELGITVPPPGAVRLMADAYNQPELGNWYCATVCDLGRGKVKALRAITLELSAIRARTTSAAAADLLDELFEIIADGKITDLEWQRLEEMTETLNRMKNNAGEVLNAITRLRRARDGKG